MLIDYRVSATKDNVSIIAIDSSKPIGGADMSFTGEVIVGIPAWWLSRLNVKKEYRRKGIGKSLINILVEHALGYPIIVAPGGYDTPVKEKKSFYASVGFVKLKGLKGILIKRG